MLFRHKPAKEHILESIASKEQIEEAERFHENLRQRYEAALQSTQDEIGAFCRSGKVTIRVSKIELLPALEILMLTGVDENGNHLVISGYYESMDVVFRRIELPRNTGRTLVKFALLDPPRQSHSSPGEGTSRAA